MWPSFRAIGRGTSENAWRNKKERKKTSLAFYKSSRTTVTGGLIIHVFPKLPHFSTTGFGEPQSHQHIRHHILFRAGPQINWRLVRSSWDYVSLPESLTGGPALQFCGIQRHLLGPHWIGLVQFQPALFLTFVFNPRDLYYRGYKIIKKMGL